MTHTPSDSSLSNITLEDDAWKDTFDKLLDPRPALRALNVIKKNVRASFNNNSSVENLSNDKSNNFLSIPQPQVRATPTQSRNDNLMTKTISTPVGSVSLKKPFKCTLSPIGAWKSIFSDKSSITEVDSDVPTIFQATPIDFGENVGVIDIEEKGKAASKENVKRLTREVKDITSNEDLIEILPEKIQSSKMKMKNRKKSNQKHIIFELGDDDLQKDGKVKKTLPLPRESKISENRKKSNQKHILFELTYDDWENDRKLRKTMPSQARPSIALRLPSGKWRKSMNKWRRTQIIQARNSDNIRNSSNFIPPDNNNSIINVSIAGRHRKSIFLQPSHEIEDSCEISKTIVRDNWQERVLKYCFQNTILNFSKIYKCSDMTDYRKIGEGAYGEVFMNVGEKDNNKRIVLKIIPIDGTDLINGEEQKSFEQILPEIVISTELSKLNKTDENSTCGFVQVKKVVCVKGKYPKHLLNLWDEYDSKKGSENDKPDVLPDEQIFIVLELSYGGNDLESFAFTNAEQSYSALLQIILTLAVGEVAYKFEHRDLHWGNVLLINTTQKSVIYKLNNKTLTLPAKGVKATIIDYTLSRMTCADCCFYNDLSNDEDLFSATGDYQYEMYRMMRDILKNNWQKSEMKTNIFWISYIIKKMLKGVTYKNTRTKTHGNFMNKLRHIEGMCLDFNSALELAKYLRSF